jgi:hypothetical protein
MKFAAYQAFCKFEVGDRVQNTEGKVMLITDIACVQYLRDNRVEFRFEFDNNGKYVLIQER